jgi:hypothetical protein
VISGKMDTRDAMKKRLSLFLLKDFGGHLLQGRMILMDQYLQNIAKIDSKVSNKKDLISSEIVILHHNIQSLSNKLLELDLLLQSDLTNVNILCFTEHWLKEDKLRLTNISHFNLVSNFSRIRNGHGGSCIYVRKYLQAKKVDCVQ